MLEIDDEAWDRLFAVNVTGVRNCMRAELAHMVGAGKGAIVNMSSTLGLVAARDSAPYVASKHAIIGLTGRLPSTTRRRASASMRCAPARSTRAWRTSSCRATRS